MTHKERQRWIGEIAAINNNINNQNLELAQKLRTKKKEAPTFTNM